MRLLCHLGIHKWWYYIVSLVAFSPASRRMCIHCKITQYADDVWVTRRGWEYVGGFTHGNTIYLWDEYDEKEYRRAWETYHPMVSK